MDELSPYVNVTAAMTQAVKVLLKMVGEDPDREGLRDTPERVCKAWLEMTDGYAITDEQSLATVFDEHTDQMVVLTGIAFHSNCEHHLLPFTGSATVGYVPNLRVVGVSKLARVVYQYSRRLQIQERMTEQIADAIHRVLAPKGVGVVVRAHHGCMSCRGVQQPATLMTTSAMRGCMYDEADTRAEFLALANGSG